MKVIEPKVELMSTPTDYESNLLHVEKCARTCYKSEGRIGPGSAEKLIRNLIKNGHEAMLEHGNIILAIKDSDAFLELENYVDDYRYDCTLKVVPGFAADKTGCYIYGNIRVWRDFLKNLIDRYYPAPVRYLLKTLFENYGIFFEDIADKLDSISRQLILELPMERCEEYVTIVNSEDLDWSNEWIQFIVPITIKFTIDRAVSMEIIRHRLASYAQESTRYCNYSKDSFGNEITVIKPCFFDENEPAAERSLNRYQMWEMSCAESEKRYFELLTMGATPQEARSVLPNSLKTELIMTATLPEWKHFLELRTAADAHPQIREVAQKVQEIINARKDVNRMRVKFAKQ